MHLGHLLRILTTNKHIIHKINVSALTIFPPCYRILIFTHLKLCLATPTHNFKWVKITFVNLIGDQTFANLDF